jgi:4-amino-4-deoxy-L-arabinose transferase-like glycosyltransferase
MLAFGAVALFAIVHQLGGRIPAYVATFLYATSPALLLNGRRAMMEGTMTLFSLLVVLAGLWVLQSRKWWAYALLGLFSGLAVASKHTAAVTVMVVFLGCSVGLIHRASKDKKQLIALFAAGILSLSVFYVLNPAWWTNPIERASEVSTIRLDFMQAQKDAFGTFENFGERLSAFFWQTFGLQNMYAETEIDHFKEHLAEAIPAYEASFFSGLVNHGLIIVPLIFMGLSIMGLMSLWLHPTVLIEVRWLIGLWVVGMIVLTLLLTPLEWQRYYLPAYAPMMLMVGLGVHFIITRIQHKRPV